MDTTMVMRSPATKCRICTTTSTRILWDKMRCRHVYRRVYQWTQLTGRQPVQLHAEHRHAGAQLKSPGRDLGMLGVLIHVIGDALNNIGVIIAALVIWLTHYEARYYADPAASMGIAIMILLTALPLVKNAGLILLESAPRGVEISDVKHDIERVGSPGAVLPLSTDKRLTRSLASSRYTNYTSGGWTRRRPLPQPTSSYRTPTSPSLWPRRRQLVNVSTPTASTLPRSSPSCSTVPPHRAPPLSSLRWRRRLEGGRLRCRTARFRVAKDCATASCAVRCRHKSPVG